MSYQWPQGNTHTQMPIQVIGNDGTPVDLTGVPFTSITLQRAIVISPGVQTYPFVACTGAVTAFTDVANGKFTYKFSTADVATPGNYQLIIVVDYGGSDVLKSLPMDFTITRTV
ncbi:MAG: hypothetical protein ACXWPI_01795 [Ktedonobacterales bacterium]